MDPLLHNRAILLAGMRELLDLADAYGSNLVMRQYFVMEATRLGLRLLAVQKEIEDRDLD